MCRAEGRERLCPLKGHTSSQSGLAAAHPAGSAPRKVVSAAGAYQPARRA